MIISMDSIPLSFNMKTMPKKGISPLCNIGILPQGIPHLFRMSMYLVTHIEGGM
jgi:hypothetical protein